MAECIPENNGYTFLWKIENYSMHALPENSFFESPTFATSKLNYSKWRLKLYPLESSQYMLALQIEKVDGTSEIIVKLSFHLITSKGPIYLKYIHEKKFDTQDASIVYYFSKQELQSIFKDGSVYTTNDTLTLNCHLGSRSNPLFPAVTFYGLTHFEVEKHAFKQAFCYNHNCPEYLCDKVIIPKSQNLPHVKVSICKTINRPYCILSVSFQIFNGDSKYNYKLKMSTSIFDLNNTLLKSANESQLFSQEQIKNSYVHCKVFQFLFAEFPSLTFTMHFNITVSSSRICAQIIECDDSLNPDCVTIAMKEEAEKAKQIPIKPEIDNTSLTGFDSLMNDLKLLLSEKKFCDITIRVDGKEFLAHRSILSIRSPVFNTMFESDMKEKKTGVVVIDDIDPDTFENFLNYLYLGKLKNLNKQNAVNLYSAAEKYQVMSLKNECSSFIFDHLSVENVCDVLVLSDMHQDEGLKKAAQKVFCIYSKTLLLSTDWVYLFEKRPQLAAETLREMALTMQ